MQTAARVAGSTRARTRAPAPIMYCHIRDAPSRGMIGSMLPLAVRPIYWKLADPPRLR